MMEKVNHNEPLLYIEQPIIHKPKSNMQKHFCSIGYEHQFVKSKYTLSISFIYMSIDEKINYLVQLPKNAFERKCKIMTKEKTYMGTIVARHDNEIDVNVVGKRQETILIDTIEQIDLLGLY